MDAEGSGGSDSGQLDPETVFNLLSHHRRRFALSYLRECEDPVLITTLAEVVSAMELEKERKEIPPEHRELTRISLFHTHLRKLAEADAVTFDETSELVTPTERASPLYAHLELENI